MLPRLEADIKAAMLSGDSEKAAALKFIKNSLMLAEKESTGSLDQASAIAILRKELKKRNEAAELFERGGKIDSATKERYEATLIQTYLPAEISEEELVSQISELINSQNIPLEVSSMGRLMGAAKQKFGDSVDGSRIAKIAGQILRGEA